MHGPREVTFYRRDEATELPPDIQQLIPHYHGIKIIQDMRAEQMCSHILVPQICWGGGQSHCAMD